MKIRWLSLAQADLESIEEYISEDSPAQAIEVVMRIIEAVEVLEDHPQIGKLGRVDGTRELVISNLPYNIPYRKNGQWIEILRVFHQARKWPEKF